jgi:hypothetical protein
MRTISTTLAMLAALAVAATTSTASAQVVQINNGFSPDPVTLRGVAGGPVEGSTIASSCRGYLPARPQHRIVTNGLSPVRIFTMAAENADVTLAIVTPTRTVYCDDDGGENMQAKLDLRLPAGTYDVYVGSFRASEQAAYSLVVTTNTSLNSETYRPSNAAVVVPANPNPNNNPNPNPNANPNNGNSPWNTPNNNPNNNPNNRPNNNPNPNQPRRIDQAATLRPVGPPVRLRNGGTQRARGRTGGSVPSSDLHSACSRGFITTEPSHAVSIDRAGLPLQFRVTSASDTTLMIRSPTGEVQCDDDSGGGFNPMIQFSASVRGAYTVWVGTFQQGRSNLYQLTATTTPR